MVYEQSMNKGTGFHSRIRDELPRTGSSPTDQGSDLRARGTSSHHSASVPADDELSGEGREGPNHGSVGMASVGGRTWATRWWGEFEDAPPSVVIYEVQPVIGSGSSSRRCARIHLKGDEFLYLLDLVNPFFHPPKSDLRSRLKASIFIVLSTRGNGEG